MRHAARDQGFCIGCLATMHKVERWAMLLKRTAVQVTAS